MRQAKRKPSCRTVLRRRMRRLPRKLTTNLCQPRLHHARIPVVAAGTDGGMDFRSRVNVVIDYDRHDRNGYGSQRMKTRLSNESDSEDEDLGKEGAEVYVAAPQEETEAR